MIHHMVVLVNTNMNEDVNEITRPYFENAWRNPSLDEIERKIREEWLNLFTQEKYTNQVIQWLSDSSKKITFSPLIIEGDVWFYTELEV